MTQIKQLVSQYTTDIIQLRRHFHTYPEASSQEYSTQQTILRELTAIGLTPKIMAKTGVVADIAGSAPGRTIALRADMDALELQDECGASYQSQHHGICHACGHDGHIAMLLGAARILQQLRHQFAGTIRLLFQPCEENLPGGAQALIQEGAIDDVDAIIGAHLWQPLEIGTVGLTYGPMMAAPDGFTIRISGRGGHASMPHQTIDPLLAGAQLAAALNTIVSRSVDPLEQAVISLGMFRAGESFNVIPDTALLSGTVRSFSPRIRNLLFQRIEQVTRGICLAAGAEFTLQKNLGSPPVINTPAITRTLAAAATAAVGSSQVLTISPVMGGEDFSWYLEKIPGAFLFIGSGNPEAGIIYPHHHPKFDIDERALAYGAEILTRAGLELLTAPLA